jgi:hypothetical protein
MSSDTQLILGNSLPNAMTELGEALYLAGKKGKKQGL